MEEKHELSHDCPLHLAGAMCVHCDDLLLNEQQVAEFARWLDPELADLETRFDLFVTPNSRRNFFGRTQQQP